MSNMTKVERHGRVPARHATPAALPPLEPPRGPHGGVVGDGVRALRREARVGDLAECTYRVPSTIRSADDMTRCMTRVLMMASSQPWRPLRDRRVHGLHPQRLRGGAVHDDVDPEDLHGVWRPHPREIRHCHDAQRRHSSRAGTSGSS